MPENELNLKEVERVGSITKKDFLENFVRPQVPVVLENLIEDWPAFEKWDFNYIREKVGDKVVPLYDDRPVDYKEGFNEPHARMKMSGENAKFYSTANTGFIAQNVYLFCASEGLATVVRGMVDRSALGEKIGLRPEQEITLVQTVGYPKE